MSVVVELCRRNCFHCFLIQSSQSCWAKSDWTTWGLKSPRSLGVLFCLHTVLKASASICYEETNADFWVSVAWENFTSTKPPLSAEGGEGKGVDEKWKTSIKTSGYCHRRFDQSQNRTQAPKYFSYSQSVNSCNKVYLSAGSGNTIEDECALSGPAYFIWQMENRDIHSWVISAGAHCTAAYCPEHLISWWRWCKA